MYTASKNSSGMYEVFKDGSRISTGTSAILQNYGLSETQLSSSAPAPTAIGNTAAPAPGAPAPAPAPTPTGVYQPTFQPYTPPTEVYKPPPPLPDSFYSSVQAGIAGGTMTPQQGIDYLNSYYSTGKYSGTLDLNKLFPAGFSYKDSSGTAYRIDQAGGYTAPVRTSTATNISKVTGDGVQTTAPIAGSTANNLYDYYTQKGQTLPSVGDRGLLYQQLGLGTAAEYTGSAMQNTALLEKLKLGDSAKSTIGAGSSTTSSPPTNSTPSGISLASALSGRTAEESLANYRTFLSSALGVAEQRMASADAAMASFWSTRKSADQILSEELDRRGIASQQSLLKDLDTQISSQTKMLENLPENIRTGLADVGVSQAQLERLTLKEAKKPTELLRKLIEDRNAMSDDIDNSIKWAERFADTRIADQAARLVALQWQVNQDEGIYKDVKGDALNLLNTMLDQKKEVYDIAMKAAENGASKDVIDQILKAESPEDAIRAAGSLAVKPTPSNTTSLSSDIKEAGTALELGLEDLGYNGRGPDGFVDPNLYVALFNQAQAMYGDSGAVEFMKKYPPKTNINPANIGTGRLPTVIENALSAAAAKSSSGATIVIDPAVMQAALEGTD